MGSYFSTNVLQDKTVVVIGGSFGGHSAAHHLKRRCNLIVIDTRDAMYLSVTSLRSVVEPGHVNRTLVPFKDLLGDSFRRGTVVKIDPSKKIIILADGSEITYDYLVIATGSSSPFPGKVPNDTSTKECHQLYKDAFQKVKAAQRITVVGGGASGVELAGEIATDFPEKDVTLIHSRDELLEPVVSHRMREMVKKQLLELKVNLVLGERVLDLSAIPRDLSGGFQEVKTNKGTMIESDLVFISVELTVNKMAYADNLADSMDKRGFLRVNPYLQVEGYENIFAIGDCCDVDKEKMAHKAELQGSIAAGNILRHASGSTMRPYKPEFFKYAVSVGRERGAVQLGHFVFGSWIVKWVKSRDMFASFLWRKIGLPMPDQLSL